MRDALARTGLVRVEHLLAPNESVVDISRTFVLLFGESLLPELCRRFPAPARRPPSQAAASNRAVRPVNNAARNSIRNPT